MRRGNKTIRNFGDQWTQLTRNEGYYASTEMLKDIFFPLVDINTLKGKKICEIGGGSGRVVNMLIDIGAKHITVLEPSTAIEVLRKNLSGHNDKVISLQKTGDDLDLKNEFDFICSIGVIHHIPNPEKTIRNIYDALKPGCKAFIWIYGKEGNEAYLIFAKLLRYLTTKLPDFLLKLLTHTLCWLLVVYIQICKVLPLPMHVYMRNVVGKYKYYNLFLTVFDQLNPDYAKYYKECEAEELLKRAGFSNVQLHNRHGYSWSIIGTKT